MKVERFNPTQLWALLNTILPATTRRVYVGYSGGIDSQVLLHALVSGYPAQLKDFPNTPILTAIHIHHGLHSAADQWVTHCQSYCDEWAVPLRICAVNPHHFSDLSPEAAAREARYLAFKQELGEHDVLVLGHHIDDQLETLLQRLCRGTGVLGLAGMAVYQAKKWPFGVVRPLLGMGVDRAEVKAYALAEGLRWVEDDSNQDLRFDRNFVRHHMVPLIKSRWPKAARAAQRTALLCREAVEACQAQAMADKILAHYSPKYTALHATSARQAQVIETELNQLSMGESLSVKQLLLLHSYRRRDVLRLWLQEKGLYPPSFAQLNRIEREVLGATKGGRPRLKIRDYIVGRWRDRLFVYSACTPLIE